MRFTTCPTKSMEDMEDDQDDAAAEQAGRGEDDRSAEEDAGAGCTAWAWLVLVRADRGVGRT